MNLLSPDVPLREIGWIPPHRINSLKDLKLDTVKDLMEHYPRRYEDRRKFDAFPDTELERPVCLRGEIIKTSARRFAGWKKVFEVVLQETSTLFGRNLTCRWFNLHYLQKMLATGQTLIVYGRPKTRGRLLVIDHPEFEILEADAEEDPIHLNRITPIYPAGEGITTRMLRSWVHRLLNQVDFTALPGCLPQWPHGFSRELALRSLHFPESLKNLEIAREALVLEEFFGLQTIVCSRRSQRNALPGIAKAASGTLLERCLVQLPFRLTGAQLRVIEEIRKDLAAPRQMNRLLQGDVGSGKTFVALAASLLTVESGHSVLLMVPTQVLADQHYNNFVRLLDPLGITVALRTSSRQESSSLPLFHETEKIQITIGTHALLYEERSQNPPPGLIIIDEQHKFGVMQRASLIGKANNLPDVLVMTATPIPRTLAHTLYGDLDISIIDEAPANRGHIVTAVRESSRLADIVRFLRGEIENARQIYIVYPLIEESEKLKVKAAVDESGRWKKLLAPHRVEVLHGRMSSEEKETTIRNFRAGEIAALISTTVIEVGVDVPNANVMLIENAERFGLAQLHQLRGRVGRGSHKSWCILLHSEKASLASINKLRVLEQTTDGFHIAEEDLRMRGPGELIGTAQTGLPGFKIGDLLRDAALMEQARDLALKTLKDDPEFILPCHQGVLAYLRHHQEKLVAASA